MPERCQRSHRAAADEAGAVPRRVPLRRGPAFRPVAHPAQRAGNQGSATARSPQPARRPFGTRASWSSPFPRDLECAQHKEGFFARNSFPISAAAGRAPTSNDAAAGDMGQRRGRQSSKCRLATQRQHAFAGRLVVHRRLGFFHGRDIARRRSWTGNGALSARASSRQVDDFQRSIGRPGIALHASRHPPVFLARTVHTDCRLCKLARGRR